jgi:hypothetical protein
MDDHVDLCTVGRRGVKGAAEVAVVHALLTFVDCHEDPPVLLREEVDRAGLAPGRVR